MNNKDYKILSIKYSKKYHQQKIFNDLIGGSTQEPKTKPPILEIKKDGNTKPPRLDDKQGPNTTRSEDELKKELESIGIGPQISLERQQSISPTQQLGERQERYTKDIDKFPGNETEYFKGIKQKINYNEQFVGFDSNNFEFKSINNEMLYHQVPHFNDNNNTTTFSTNILEVLKRQSNDEDYFANSFIKEDKSIKEYNKASFENKEYELLENITNSIVDVTNDYRNNNTKEELDKTMFLFGIPSVNIINLLRLIVDSYIIKGKYGAKLKMMTGFVEINDPHEGNIILVSISEGTFNEIDKKVIKFLEFLQNLNLELQVELPNSKMGRSDYYIGYIERFNDIFLEKLKSSGFEFKTNHKGDTILSYIPLTPYQKLINLPKVRFVFSHKYNADRYNGFESHVPAKKSQKCNNGSTCVEPKLFSYISDLFNTNYPSNHIIGSVAYWFNDIEPTAKVPGCSKAKYCFEKYDKLKDNEEEIDRDKIDKRKTKHKQNAHIRSLMARMINDKVGDELINVKQNEGENTLLDIGANYVTNDVDEFVLHGFALPCPGCQLNYFNFLLNKKDYWNHLFCNEEVFKQETEKIRPFIEEELLDLGAEDKGDYIPRLKNFSTKK
jgi:hypothetical protein